MGLLDQAAGSALGAIGLKSVTSKKLGKPSDYGPDFTQLKVTEYIDGKAGTEANGYGFTLSGNFMPMVPFTYGGAQEIKKDYYPGNSEPVIQVLGPREDSVTIKGKFRTKRFKDTSLRAAAQEYQEQVDAVRLRGNLLFIQLGEWHRWGYIESCSFDLKTLQDIDYSISFAIVGFNRPKFCKNIQNKDDSIISANRDLISKANAALASMKNYPSEMPRTLSDFLDEQIGIVAGVIGLVTGFVDGILTDVENLSKSANRALGLIKNAQSTISKTNRRIGAISQSFSSMGAGFSRPDKQVSATYNNVKHFNSTARSMQSLSFFLAELRKKYEGLSQTVPMKRHRVKDGDNLQRLSIQYYNDADHWKKIYDHNKLSSTELVVGNVLEIPKL